MELILLVAIYLLIRSALNRHNLKTHDSTTPNRTETLKSARHSWIGSPTNNSEREVAIALKSIGSEYTIFNNLILSSRGGNTQLTQVDHVVVSRYGIFCIETKATSGNIYGRSSHDKWKQYLGGGNYTFYNPLKQNYLHIRALKGLLGDCVKEPIVSYIVFTNANKVMLDGKVEDFSIRKMLTRILTQNTEIYNEYEVEGIVKSLSYAYFTAETDGLHERQIQETKTYLATLSQ